MKQNIWKILIIALLAISIGAMILSGLVTIYYDVPIK